jgi:hypothetical protein
MNRVSVIVGLVLSVVLPLELTYGTAGHPGWAWGLPHLGVASARATTFLNTLGFEDDVDVVTAWNGEFAVVCEEAPDGSAARTTIVDLEAATGRMLAVAWQGYAVGFEHAVDPIIPDPGIGGLGTFVVVPLEAEDGSAAELMLQHVNSITGAVAVAGLRIELGYLGFCVDVDFVVAP